MTTRRLLPALCLASMLVGDIARAGALIIYPYATHTDALSAGANRQFVRDLRVVQSIIRATGGTSVAERSDKSRTEWARLAQRIINPGTAGASIEQHDAVIFTASTSVTASAGQARPDSLLKTIVLGRAGKSAPALVFKSTGEISMGANSELVWGSASAIDSGGAHSLLTFGGAVFQPGSTEPFMIASVPLQATDAIQSGGANIRKLLVGATPAIAYRASRSDHGGTLACKDCDSLASYSSSSDTLVLWEKEWGTSADGTWGVGLATGGVTVNSTFGGVGLVTDTIGTDYPVAEGEPIVALAALARLDSLVRSTSTTGGTVLGDKVIVVAPVVVGGLSRGRRHAWQVPGSAQGIAPEDTAAFYAILDSLSARGIPLTFAVNSDSAADYSRDIIKLKSVKSAKFTPSIWSHLPDTLKGDNASMQRPIDVFGRFRKRAAYGDSSRHYVNGSDTTIHWLAKRSLAITDSIFGHNRVSRVAVAPDDDWSPINTDGVLSGTLRVAIDSVLFALQQAGFVGLVSDGQDPDANASKRGHGPSKTNPRGYYNQQQSYSSGLVRDFKILTHSGYFIMGGRAQVATGSDSTTQAGGLGYDGVVSQMLLRLYGCALLDYDENYDMYPYDGDRTYANIQRRAIDWVAAGRHRPIVRANVFRLSCSDLSGVPYGGPGGAPAANGYWALVSADNAFKTINRLAGRTIIRFGYPEEIDP